MQKAHVGFTITQYSRPTTLLDVAQVIKNEAKQGEVKQDMRLELGVTQMV